MVGAYKETFCTIQFVYENFNFSGIWAIHFLNWVVLLIYFCCHPRDFQVSLQQLHPD